MDHFRSLCLAIVALAGVVAVSGGTATAAAPSTGKKADRNGDGLPDKWEKRYGLSLRLKQGPRDPDRDGLANRDEYRLGTHPRYRDTDADLLRDGAELPTGHDPLDKDSDDDGVQDGRENPGRIVSFADGVLELALSDGEQLTPVVTGDTVILCLVPADVDPDDAKDESRGDVADGDPVIARTDFEADQGEPADDGPTAGIGDPRPEACTQDDLVADAVVSEAELRVADGTLVARTIVLRRNR